MNNTVTSHAHEKMPNKKALFDHGVICRVLTLGAGVRPVGVGHRMGRTQTSELLVLVGAGGIDSAGKPDIIKGIIKSSMLGITNTR